MNSLELTAELKKLCDENNFIDECDLELFARKHGLNQPLSAEQNREEAKKPCVLHITYDAEKIKDKCFCFVIENVHGCPKIKFI